MKVNDCITNYNFLYLYIKYFLELNGIPDRISYINTFIENIDKTIHNMTEVYLAFTTKLSFFFRMLIIVVRIYI